jgi:hypothetical protein
MISVITAAVVIHCVHVGIKSYSEGLDFFREEILPKMGERRKDA